ncbi:MAG: WYL domain-containing protein [Micropepsaceae bacterium]
MAFAKADQLLELAAFCAARRGGITLDDVMARFGGVKRTAQRMLHTLETQFNDTRTHVDEDGRKRWSRPGAGLKDFLTLTSDELAALELAGQALAREGDAGNARHLERLQDKLRALVPKDRAARLETDHDALLEAQGFVARPGPRPRGEPQVADVLAEAIKACRVVEITYRGKTSRVHPYGLLAGMRRYLVVRAASRPGGEMGLRRMDLISAARLTEESFARDETFDLDAYARRSFGVFQSPEEFGEVVWRFAPEAAGAARDFVFHPSQSVSENADGSLTVRFEAAGWLEMAWHLYMWGDKVEVLKPAGLKAMVGRHRRGDWPGLP